MYIKTTRKVKVTAQPAYLPHQSEPAGNHYVWSYTIRLENMGGEAVQLLSRYWQITDAFGMRQEVRGEGVVGEQPKLEAGASYQYTSGASLNTPSGMMVGSYRMVALKTGEQFDIDIPAFSLDSPFERKVAH